MQDVPSPTWLPRCTVHGGPRFRPVFDERAAALPFAGPKRLQAPAVGPGSVERQRTSVERSTPASGIFQTGIPKT